MRGKLSEANGGNEKRWSHISIYVVPPIWPTRGHDIDALNSNQVRCAEAPICVSFELF